MLSIPSALSLHRATRDRYMFAARSAREAVRIAKYVINNRHAFADYLKVPRHTEMENLYKERQFNKDALRCFLRHARAANRKLVALKRFQRQWDEQIIKLDIGSEPRVYC